MNASSGNSTGELKSLKDTKQNSWRLTPVDETAGENKRGVKTGLLRRMFRQRDSGSGRGLGRSKPLVETIYEGVTMDVSLEIDPAHIDVILTRVIMDFSRSSKLIKTARSLSYKIGPVRQAVGKRIGGVEWEEIAVVLEMLLSSTKGLPGSVVAYVYTYLGMIRQRQKRFDMAVDAFVKALWIRKSSNQSPELIAVASYRLGAAYCLNNDKENAMAALKQAIQHFSSPSATISMDHDLVLATQNKLFIVKNYGRASSEKILRRADSERDTETVTTAGVTASSWTERGSRSRLGA